MAPVATPRTTSRDRVARDNEIVEARARGESWTTVAAQNGVSDRHARRVVENYASTAPNLQQRDPIEVVEQMLERYESAHEDLVKITKSARNDSARVGAVRARIDVTRAQAELLQATGVLPRNLGALAVQVDVRRFVEQVVNVFDKFDVPEAAEQELLEALRGTGTTG